MKKLLSILAMALCFVACQNDGVENVSNNDLVDVVLTVDAPELGITRADGDLFKGKSSAYGAIDFMNDADWGGYDLRYILEVYAEDDTNGANGMIYSERLVNCLDKYAETTFALRLVPGRTYKFVVFADFVAEGNAERTEPADKLAIADLYYNTADLRNISAITTEQTWGAMNEVRDAYFVSENVEITTNLSKKLTLTRPFAKLRVITTDLSYIKGYTAPGYVEITYKNEPIYKSFNAVNGELNTDSVMTGAELTYGYEVSKTTPYTDGYDSNPTNQTLFTDYLLAVDDEQTPVNFEMTVYESKGGRKIYSHDFNTQIPIERNHLTTIVGDLLTTQANITIEINDNFDEKEYVIGWGDENNIVIEENKWGNGEYVDGKYQFLVEAEGDEFTVNVNAAAVKNGALDAATYIWADDAQEGTTHTFSVEGLKANETTRALVDVEVLGGRMHVQSMDNNYKVLLNLVVKFSETDIRNTVYEYNGSITFGKILEAPAVKAVAEGNTVTVSWTAVDGATSYLVAMGDAEAEETTELSKVYTDLAWETEYTFSVKAVADGVESVAATATATTEAEPKPEARTITVYSTNTEVEQVYIYTWAEDGTLLTGEWPGTAMTVAAEQTEPNCKTFTYIFGAEYDGKVVNFIFNNGQGGEGNQTEDLKGNVLTEDLTFSVTLNAVAVQPEPEPTDTPEYQVAIPEGYTGVIFVRMNPASTENNWDNKWNQTGDLRLADLNGNNWFTPSGWDGTTTTWSKFEAGVDGYLYFTPSDWSADNARFAAYFFGNGEKWVDLESYTPAVAEPVALATPVVKAEVEGDMVTLKWELIDGAKNYTATLGDAELVVEGSAATFDEVTAGTYTATVVANPADTTVNTASEAGTVEIVVEEVAEEVVYTTVAEFLALEDVVPQDATAEEIAAAPLYTLKGTIISVTNTTYGNFYLNDGTGEVLIYGLCSPEGESKYWATSEAKVGDDIVVKTIRTEYSGSPQGKNAIFVELLPGTLAFWSFETTSVQFTAAAGEKTIEVNAYNLKDTVSVASDNDQFTAAYADGVLTITAKENTSTEKIGGNITVTCGSLSQDVTISQNGASSGDKTEYVATLTFDDKTNKRTEYSTSSQTWTENGVTFVNEKAASTTNVGDYEKPVRCYASSKVTVSVEGEIATIVFDCNSSSYATALGNSIGDTATVSSDKVTVSLNGEPSYTVAKLSAQVRFDAVTVTYFK